MHGRAALLRRLRSALDDQVRKLATNPLTAALVHLVFATTSIAASAISAATATATLPAGQHTFKMRSLRPSSVRL